MVNNTKKWNPPTAQLAVWKSYSDKHPKSLHAAWRAVPEPKPSYAIFLDIMNNAFGLSPLQKARQLNKMVEGEKNRKYPLRDNLEQILVGKPVTFQPIRTAPPVSPDRTKQVNPNDKIVEIIWNAIKANSPSNGDEFKGFVKGLLTGFELK